MSGRLSIGLRYKHQDQWVGGVYYVRNLVRAFGLLPPARRPRLTIVGGDKAALADLKAATGYGDLHRVSRTRIRREPARRLDLPFARGADDEIDLLLMGSPPGLEDRGVQWVPDFQEHRFPAFFPPDELKDRMRRNRDWFARHAHVMVSSQDVAADFRRHYGAGANELHVVRFASFVAADMAGADIRATAATYGLPERYFICNNQMWRHKNHAVILRALAAMGPQAPPVVFTGREEDYRDPDHAPGVRALAAALGAGDRVRFLGFLPRGDQLGLMAGAVAVVQPSLCEGWSTVVEDAKALGRHVIASDIAVHREQLATGADFFAPDDAEALAGLLKRYAAADPPPVTADYRLAERRFADELWRMVTAVERDFRRRKVPRLVVSP